MILIQIKSEAEKESKGTILFKFVKINPLCLGFATAVTSAQSNDKFDKFVCLPLNLIAHHSERVVGDSNSNSRILTLIKSFLVAKFIPLLCPKVIFYSSLIVQC